MLFNSLAYAAFLPFVFAAYWMLGRRFRAQNALLLAASYFFYGCWDWRFLGLLLFSTLLDYAAAIRIAAAKRPASRQIWLWTSIGINLGLLAVFKYYNFFASSLQHLLQAGGMEISLSLLGVILPVGISFYTFHGLSYIIDVFKRRIEPEREPVTYALFVSFFPLLVAGPIERATHLLPQLKKPRRFAYATATDGLRQILWGLFKKVVIADACAQCANEIFLNYHKYSGSTLAAGAFFFAIQIYGDFSGYSDIAIGSGRLLGIDLLRNFAFPYFSRDIAEFWRRWHISLSSWFKDYVYIPLGGNAGPRIRVIRNVFIVFLLSGLWHGANWTFIAWGGLHALYFLPLLVMGRNRRHLSIVSGGSFLPSAKDLLRMGLTFCLCTFAWIFFRAESLPHATAYIGRMFTTSWAAVPVIRPRNLLLLIVLMFIAEWIGREGKYGLEWAGRIRPRAARWALYYGMLVAVYYGTIDKTPFLYFQF